MDDVTQVEEYEITEEGLEAVEDSGEDQEEVTETASESEVLTFIQTDMPQVFLLGFAAGLLIMATVFAVRVVSRLFARIVRS